MTYPDYDRSLLSLVSSLLNAYGVGTEHKTLPALDWILSRKYKNVVLMVFDGMGTAILDKHRDASHFFRAHTVCNISSVFPPTTTAATTTLQSGLSPAEHGWIGWNLYFDEIDANVNIFPNTLANGAQAAEYKLAERHMTYKTVCEKINEATRGEVSAEVVSLYSKYKSTSVDSICTEVKRICGSDGRHFVYTYWHQPDYDMHNFGTPDEKISADIDEANKKVQALCGELDNTLVLVTADHGLVDVKWLFLNDYPDIKDCLTRVPSVEARALTFNIKKGLEKRFETLFNESFGEYYRLFSRREVLDLKLFGNGTPHPRFDGFIGDYLAVATGAYGIECSDCDRTDMFKAAHAGMTPDEFSVPLIVIDTTNDLS